MKNVRCNLHPLKCCRTGNHYASIDEMPAEVLRHNLLIAGAEFQRRHGYHMAQARTGSDEDVNALLDMANAWRAQLSRIH